MSAIASLCRKIERLQEEMNGLRSEITESKKGSTEVCDTNVNISGDNEYHHTSKSDRNDVYITSQSICGDEEHHHTSKSDKDVCETSTSTSGGGDDVPLQPLLVLNGKLNDVSVRVLKDDGCNTNVISQRILDLNRQCFRTKRKKVVVRHSRDGWTEVSSTVVVNGTLKIGSHTYTSNWVVMNTRYDVLLGMPWHVANNPEVNYPNRIVKVNEEILGLENPNEVPEKEVSTVTNVSVKKFRRLLRKKSPKIEVFQVLTKVVDEVSKVRKPPGDKKLEKLLQEYRPVFRSELPDGLPPKRLVEHAIEVEEGSKPPHRPLYQLSPAELRAVKHYVESLLKSGKIRRSSSPYGAPLFFVKEGDKLRGVVDYRALNRITKRNNAPIPRSDEMFDRIGGAKYFSRLDLKTGFHQIRVRNEDIEKTAFNTKYGQFEYLVMPMGACNSPATFQTLMNQIFHDCIDDFMVVYIDDLLIFSKDRESHYAHLEKVLSRLRDHELYVSPKKCEFMKTEIDFLGLVIGRNGIRVDDRKVEILRTWPRPNSLTDLRSFLGLLQFFRRFIPDFAKVASPLTNLLKKDKGLRFWNESCDEAFETLKTAITNAPILVAPDWSKPFRGHVDASQTAIGGTLTQRDENGMDRVISFYSKKLSPAEMNYTANDRELLALVKFLERFRCYLEGSEFEMITDNQVLKHFFTKPKLSRREARWVETLGNFGVFPITLKPGKVHVLGDTLSRAPHARSDPDVNAIDVPFINFKDVIGSYDEDQFFKPIVRALNGEWPETPKEKKRIEELLPMFKLEDDKLLCNGKLCVPRKSVSTILQMAHDSRVGGHFKFAKTMSRLINFHWRHKSRDVKKYVAGCLTCQQYKDTNQRKLNDPMSLEMPERRWGSLATDFIVQLPKTKDGYDAITTWVDRLTRRVHFLKCKTSDTAVNVADAFFANIFKLHGLPDSIVSDRDSKFTSAFWKRLMELSGIHLKMSSSRHPQTDGASEIMNRMIENYLRCYCSYHQNDWDELLPAAEFAYNSAVTEDLGMSPFELDLGWIPKSPLDFIATSEVPVESVNEFKERLKNSLDDAQYSYRVSKARQLAESSVRSNPPRYVKGSKVWLNRTLFTDAYAKSQESAKLSAKRFGPFEVKELVSKNAVRLDLPKHLKIHDVVHVSHTVPFVDQPNDIALPIPPKPAPVPAVEGEEHVVERILKHRKRGRGFQFLTQMRGDPSHDVTWQPTKDFVDSDGTVTKVWQDYIRSHNILQQYH